MWFLVFRLDILLLSKLRIISTNWNNCERGNAIENRCPINFRDTVVCTVGATSFIGRHHFNDIPTTNGSRIHPARLSNIARYENT
ncbi:hypothetical protein V1477_020642 [Vespula maculifrons]|uniref:Secreted protein n=1 Tax=Vespula maculifrons TaxID=7453 RepID=A0ABD2ANC6_VESMC